MSTLNVRLISTAVLIFGMGSLAPAVHGQAPAGDPYQIAGRADDARVASVAYRIATAGLVRCPRPTVTHGMVLQHQSQFQLADRAGMNAAYALDSGPGVVGVVEGGPGARAGVRPGDVMLAIDREPLPVEQGGDFPFDQGRSRARADQILSLLEAKRGPHGLTLLRAGRRIEIMIAPSPACPSRVHLARSDQRNAYADGSHVFLTTGLLKMIADDNQLAFVIAHEMAHNILRHAAEMRAAGVKQGLGRTLGRSGRTLRAAERAADNLAGHLLVDAGHDPVAGAAVLGRFGEADLGLRIFAAHDSIGDRIAAMRAIVEAQRQAR